MAQNRLSGVIVPLVTPFDSQLNINESVLRALVDRQIAAGVDALMVAGTTGEAPLLSLEERKRLAEVVVEQASGRVPVVAQVGTAATRESAVLAQHAHSCGAAAISVVCPYFFGIPDQALVEHFCQIAAAVPPDFPVYLYNIPQHTGNAISAAVSEAVAGHCLNVVGEKDSSGDLNLLAAKRQVRGGQFDLLIGSDALVLSALVLGACGAVAGNANVFPELFVNLFRAYRASNMSEAEQAQRQIYNSTSSFKANIALFKAALQAQGLDAGSVRPPLPPANDASKQACLDQLRDAGLLQA
jgi:4-hydroxy-tetrahydrodipicolinate synthase